MKKVGNFGKEDFPVFPPTPMRQEPDMSDFPVISKHDYGYCITPGGPWTDECSSLVNEYKPVGLNLSFGGEANDLPRGLAELGNPVAVRIGLSYDSDISCLAEHQASLESIDIILPAKGKLDVSTFPRLRRLILGCMANAVRGVEDVGTLTDLLLYGGPKFSSLAHFRKLKNLRRLEIIKGGIEELGFDFDRPDLRELKITHCYKFRSLEGLQHAPNLKCLEVVSAKKLEGIEPIKHVAGLQWLTLEKCGGVSDIETILELKQLEYLNLIDSTSFSDDEYDRLLELPDLDAPAFTPRRHNDWQRTLSLRQKLNKRKLERSGDDWVQQLQSSWWQAK